MKSYDEEYFAEEGFIDLPEDDPGLELIQMTKSLNKCRQQLLRMIDKMKEQKRSVKEMQQAGQTVSFDFINSLLPVKDSLEKSLDIAYMEDGKLKAEEWLEGMSSTLKILDNAFKKAGIKEIDSLGKTFDPEIHEAQTIKKVEDVPPYQVLCVYRKGYMIHGQLIRPARVEVSVF